MNAKTKDRLMTSILSGFISLLVALTMFSFTSNRNDSKEREKKLELKANKTDVIDLKTELKNDLDKKVDKTEFNTYKGTLEVYINQNNKYLESMDKKIDILIRDKK